jgi:nitrite reductase (NADH) small subunit
MSAWVPVCRLADLAVERGAAALLATADEPEQIALFRMIDDEVLAVQQLDPYSGANVMARGIVGTRGGELTVAGPVYKQVFSLRTGRCLDAAGYTPRYGLPGDLTTYPAQVVDGVVMVGMLSANPDDARG